MKTEGEGVFELISETPQGRAPIYFFILAHGYEENEKPLDWFIKYGDRLLCPSFAFLQSGFR